MSTAIKKELHNYKERITELDDQADQLDDYNKKQYEAARSQFMSRLTAWEQSIDTEIELLRKNVEEGYHELESKIL